MFVYRCCCYLIITTTINKQLQCTHDYNYKKIRLLRPLRTRVLVRGSHTTHDPLHVSIDMYRRGAGRRQRNAPRELNVSITSRTRAHTYVRQVLCIRVIVQSCAHSCGFSASQISTLLFCHLPWGCVYGVFIPMSGPSSVVIGRVVWVGHRMYKRIVLWNMNDILILRVER